jgi:hypothetical protein
VDQYGATRLPSGIVTVSVGLAPSKEQMSATSPLFSTSPLTSGKSGDSDVRSSQPSGTIGSTAASMIS